MPVPIAVLLLGLFYCAPTPPPRPVRLDRAFALAPGETARVDGLEVRFDRVKDDSRCPVDVQCVWAGDAVVVVSVRRGAAARDLELHASESPREATFEGFRIVLTKLEPAPRSNREIAAGAYRATLSVSRAASTASPRPPSPSASPGS